MVNWSAHTKQTLPFNCKNTRQNKTKAHKVHIDEGKSASARERILMMGKADRREAM